MVDITPYIQELLYRHDCVIIPSFGGFIGNYRPAALDRAESRFSPPVKAISFNRNLTHNDGLLIGEVSQRKNIGYADAKLIVDEFVERAGRKLQSGEKLLMEGIGSFRINADGNIEFEPCSDTNFLLDSFGLTSFRRERVQGFDGVRPGAMHRNFEPMHSSSNRKMVMRAIIAVPFVAAMILVPLKTDLFRNGASLNPVEVIANKLDSSKDDAITPVVEELTAVSDEELAGQLEEQDYTAVGNDHLYYLVAGSFRNRDNALRLMDEAVSKGYNASIADNGQGYFRVLIATFETKKDAAELSEKLRSEYPDNWILAD